jgi:hypothetical protein
MAGATSRPDDATGKGVPRSSREPGSQRCTRSVRGSRMDDGNPTGRYRLQQGVVLVPLKGD